MLLLRGNVEVFPLTKRPPHLRVLRRLPIPTGTRYAWVYLETRVDAKEALDIIFLSLEVARNDPKASRTRSRERAEMM